MSPCRSISQVCNHPFPNMGFQVMNRTCWGYALAQCIMMTCVVALATVLPIIGSSLAPSQRWATLPSSFSVAGLAIFAFPAGALMVKIGRRFTFVTGSVVGTFGALLCFLGVICGWFWVLCTGAFLVGANNACVQYYRFGAASSVEVSRVPFVHSVFILLGIPAAVAGGFVVSLVPGREWLGDAAVLAAVASLIAITALIHLADRGNNASVAREQSDGPHLLTLHDLSILGCSSAISAFMTLIMTAAPIEMLTATRSMSYVASAMQLHFLGMYAPPIVAGVLVAKGWRAFPILLGCCAGLLSTLYCLVLVDGNGFAFLLPMCGAAWALIIVPLSAAVSSSGKHRLEIAFASSTAIVSAFSAFASGGLLTYIGWRGVLWSSVVLVGLAILSSVVYLTVCPSCRSLLKVAD